MRNIILLYLMIGGGLTSYCQSVSPELLASSGGFNLSGSIKLHWAIGESAVSAHRNGLVLTEGFFQAWGETVPVINTKWDIDLSIYPNPVSSILTVKHGNKEDVHASVFDLLGQEVIHLDRLTPQHKIDLTGLAAGPYLIHLSTDSGKHTIHKCIKL